MSEPSWLVLDPGDPQITPRPGDRARARALLARARVLGADAEAARRWALTMVDATVDPLGRDQLPDHLTASAVVVDPNRGALLVEHRKLGRWLQPGGHVDGDGNLLAAALREASEETGLPGLVPVLPAVDVDVHDVAYPDGSFHVHHDLRFLLLAGSAARVRLNHESTGSRWVRTDADLDELDVDAGTRRLVRRGLDVAAAIGSA